MDENLRKRLEKDLPTDLFNYEKSIEETDEHYDELKRLGRYTASAPYGYKHLLPFRIHLLEEEGINCESFRAEYKRITPKLMALEQKRGQDYREKLFSLLKDEVLYYPGTIEYFADLEPFELEMPNDLSIRSSLEILLMELERDYDLTEIKAKVSALDEVFRRKYLQHIDEVIEYCADAVDPYTPESFWWEHPLKLLKEKQAMQNNS